MYCSIWSNCIGNVQVHQLATKSVDSKWADEGKKTVCMSHRCQSASNKPKNPQFIPKIVVFFQFVVCETQSVHNVNMLETALFMWLIKQKSTRSSASYPVLDFDWIVRSLIKCKCRINQSNKNNRERNTHIKNRRWTNTIYSLSSQEKRVNEQPIKIETKIIVLVSTNYREENKTSRHKEINEKCWKIHEHRAPSNRRMRNEG